MSASRHQVIDLSHTVRDGLVTYRGLPAPRISDFLSREASRSHYASGIEFHIGRIDMVSNTGTYVDAPSHRYPDGVDLSGLALESLANLRALVLHAPQESASRDIDGSLLRRCDVSGKAVLVHTGWSRHWDTERYFEGHPYLTEDAAECLIDAKASLVGIDSLNIDDTADPSRPVHSRLLAAGIPIVEHLTNLERRPDEGFHFFAVPAKVKGLGSFPVRAFAIT
jgi:kynurenine formamidase